MHSDDCRITKACRECEEWQEKDIIYVVGCAPKDHIKMLWMVYGDCYAADREVYEKVQKDPLGITLLRVRGMWIIDNPTKAFNYLYEIDKALEFQIVALMKQEKYDSFPENDRNALENYDGITVKDVQIKSPNNPAQFLGAKLITFQK